MAVLIKLRRLIKLLVFGVSDPIPLAIKKSWKKWWTTDATPTQRDKALENIKGRVALLQASTSQITGQLSLLLAPVALLLAAKEFALTGSAAKWTVGLLLGAILLVILLIIGKLKVWRLDDSITAEEIIQTAKADIDDSTAQISWLEFEFYADKEHHRKQLIEDFERPMMFLAGLLIISALLLMANAAL